MNEHNPQEDMIAWAEQTGSSKFERPDLSVAQIAEFFSQGLSDRETGEVEDFLCLIEAYNLWLRNTCGSILAMIRHMESEFNHGLAKNVGLVSKKFVGNDIKEAIICNSQPKLRKLKDKLTRFRMKYDKISRLPQSIDASIRTIENSLRRRNGG